MYLLTEFEPAIAAVSGENIFLKREEVTGGWRKLHDDNFVIYTRYQCC
jgi:hypothetical protein